MAPRHTISHCNLICLFKTSLQILTVFAITLYFSRYAFLSQRIPGKVKHVFVYWNRFNGIMNDDALNRGCIYKFLSNFYFLLLFPGSWHRSWQCRVCLCSRQGGGGHPGAGGLSVTHSSPTTQLLHKSSPILKMKNINKTKNKAKHQNLGPHRVQQPGVWLVRNTNHRRGLFYTLSETTSIASIATLIWGEMSEMCKPAGPFCQHLGSITLGTHPAAGSVQQESSQGDSTLDTPRNVEKLCTYP